MRRNIISWIVFILFVLFALFVIFNNASTNAVAEIKQTFDHSNCQYPDRLSNPADGCDNSDPVCGEIAKGATSCLSTDQTSYNINTVDKPVESVHNNDCNTSIK